ncbi:MAG: toll/interleukin-1 receptor domain-containing protein [Pseudomonadota bacterium]
MDADPVRIFVSYRHRDFKARFGLPNSRCGEIFGMITEDLNIGLDGCGFEIVRDVKFMSEGNPVAGEIEEALQASDCAIVFMTDSYLLSEYCRGEYQRLMEMGKPIHVLQMEDVSGCAGQHPDTDKILKHQSEHKFTAFWKTDPDTQISRPLGAPLPSKNEADLVEVFTLAQDAARGLRDRAAKIRLNRKMQAAITSAPVHGQAARGAGHVKVCFAAPTRDARELTDRLISRVSEHQYEIVRLDISGEAGGLADDLTAQMADCRFFVQMIGNFPGRPIGPERQAQILFQNAVARDVAAETDMEVIAWRDREVPVEELGEDFEAAMQEIQPHNATFDSFQTYVTKLLAEAATDADIQTERGEVEMPWVILDGDPSDKDLILKLRGFLSQEQANVRIMSQEGGPELMKALADAPLQNDGAIVIYGREKSSQKRANTHFEILTRNLMKTENRNLTRPAVGNNAAEDAFYPMGPHWDVLHLYDGFDEAQVRDYLKTVRENMSA